MASTWDTLFATYARSAVPGWDALTPVAREKAAGLLARWLGGDRGDLDGAIAAACADPRVTLRSLAQALAAAARGLTGGHAIAAREMAAACRRLEAGSISMRDLADVAAEWAASCVTDPGPRQLIRSAAGGAMASGDVRDTLLAWLRRIDATAVAPLVHEPVTLRRVTTLLTAYLVRTRRIADAGSDPAEQAAALNRAIAELDAGPEGELISAAMRSDYRPALGIVLSRFGAAVDDNVLHALFDGHAGDAIPDHLAEAVARSIAGVTSEQAGALAHALVGLATGRAHIIAEQSERQDLAMDDGEYEVWLGVRRVIYTAALATRGGPAVAEDALTRPDTAARNRILFDSRLTPLVDAGAQPLFCSLMARFASAHFGVTIPALVTQAALTGGGDDGRGALAKEAYVRAKLALNGS